MEIDKKIVYGLERLADAYKVLLWEKTKEYGISPIQIQLLIFVSKHHLELCNVSHLAKEFNLTKPTISDAVRVLLSKEFIAKDFSGIDGRSYNLVLTPYGIKLIQKLSEYTAPVIKAVGGLQPNEKADIYSTISVLIDRLNTDGVIQVQRNCFSCRFYSGSNSKHHCAFLDKELFTGDLQLDCPDHLSKR